MINDIKMGFKLLKYGHCAKLSFVACIISAVFSVVWSFLSIGGHSSFPGGYFLMLASLFLIQLLCTVNAASLVASSPAKKKLQTKIPALLSTVTMLASHLINVASLGIFACMIPRAMERVCTLILISAFLMGVVMLYTAICYKCFVLGTVLFVVIFIAVYGPMMNMVYGSEDGHRGFMLLGSDWGNFWLASVLGLGIVLVSGLLQYLISLAVYKLPISKLALGARLRGQM